MDKKKPARGERVIKIGMSSLFSLAAFPPETLLAHNLPGYDDFNDQQKPRRGEQKKQELNQYMLQISYYLQSRTLEAFPCALASFSFSLFPQLGPPFLRGMLRFGFPLT